VDRVRDASLQRPDRFFRSFAFSNLLIEVHPTDGAGAQLRDSCNMDGMVQDAVPSQIQTVPGEGTSIGAVALHVA
jgi:hypothetical protein